MNDVEVHQLTSKGNEPKLAYFNVDQQYGSIAVSTFPFDDQVVILARHPKVNKAMITLIAFDSVEYFNEWREAHKEYMFERIN